MTEKYAIKIEQGTKCAYKRCGCYSVFQDKRYGKGKRLHNPTSNGSAPWRCTVCGKTR